MADGKGNRFNQGKLRYELVPQYAQEQYVQVLSSGAVKYGDNNWRRGMEWKTVIASLKRHTIAMERGEDYDPESGFLHTAHIMCNAAFLTEYYKIYPQGDNRQHEYLNRPKIGLDIDGVLSDFNGQYEKYRVEQNKTKILPTLTQEVWNYDLDMSKKILELSKNKKFWCEMPILTKPNDIPFEPHCYITSRSIPTEWTEEWLHLNGFPNVPVYSVGIDKSKLEIAKECGIDIFIDDRFENFVELNKNGICCYLFDAPYNKRYNVGHKRIKFLKDLLILKK